MEYQANFIPMMVVPVRGSGTSAIANLFPQKPVKIGDLLDDQSGHANVATL